MNSSRSRRWIFPRLAIGAVLLVAVISLLAGCTLLWTTDNPFSSKPHTGPPPPAYVWKRVTPPATAQQAYAAGISELRLCISSITPARSVTDIWLVAGPTYGVVLLLADCSNQRQDTRQGIAILPIALDKSVQPKCSAWVLGEGGMLTRRLAADTNLGQSAYQIPLWLPLPNGTYLPETLGGGIVPSALFSLESHTRLFITGRFMGSATRPAGAQTVSIGGRSGWQTSEHGIVTVTLPLTDGWTFFFSGTADATTMQ